MPENLYRFEMVAGQEMQRVVNEYTYSLSRDLDTKSVEEVLQDRKHRARFSDWKDENKSRLTEFDEAFRVDAKSEMKAKKRGFFARLFGKK